MAEREHFSPMPAAPSSDLRSGGLAPGAKTKPYAPDFRSALTVSLSSDWTLYGPHIRLLYNICLSRGVDPKQYILLEAGAMGPSALRDIHRSSTSDFLHESLKRECSLEAYPYHISVNKASHGRPFFSLYNLSAMAQDIRVSRQHKLSTTSCHQVIYEDIQRKNRVGTIIIQSDLSQSKLFPAVTGHVVNQRVLCPSTLYAEMAMTAADYLHRCLNPKAPEIGLNVCDMEVHSPLVAEIPPPEDGQHIQLEARADMGRSEVTVNVRSVTWDGKPLQKHSHGLVKYEDPTHWAEEWSRQKYLVKCQIELLQSRFEHNKAHKFLRGLAYKLFSTLVTYSPKYQGMEEVILDKEVTAGTAQIKFQVRPGVDGEFFCSPYYIDNLCHLSGFIVNAADVDSEDPLVYISHGWESLKFLKPTEISPSKTYTSYVRMIPQEKNVSAGDVYVFDGEDIVAVLYGLKFQGIPQRLMDVLLPPIRNTTKKGKSTV